MNLKGIYELKKGEPLPEGHVSLYDVASRMTAQEFQDLLELYDEQYDKLSNTYGPWTHTSSARGWLSLATVACEEVSVETKKAAVRAYITMLDHYAGVFKEVGDLELPVE